MATNYEEYEDKLYDAFGGKWFDLNTLPDGTEFYVVNGSWTGKIVRRGMQKYVVIPETETEFELKGEYLASIKLVKHFHKVVLNENDVKMMTIALTTVKGIVSENIEDWCDEFLLRMISPHDSFTKLAEYKDE